MSRICQITGKKGRVGCNVSHSNHRTKRRFKANIFTKRFYYAEEGCWITLKVSTAGLRTIDKLGLDKALAKAVENGHTSYGDIKIIG